jgi:hypothetical protein
MQIDRKTERRKVHGGKPAAVLYSPGNEAFYQQ